MHAAQTLPTPSAQQTPLTLGHIPKTLYLPRGKVLACIDGCLWITSDALAGFGRDSDVVLESGQSFVTLQAATYFVSAPLGWGVLSFLPVSASIQPSLETTC
jgi:hypothetical protein